MLDPQRLLTCHDLQDDLPSAIEGPAKDFPTLQLLF